MRRATRHLTAGTALLLLVLPAALPAAALTAVPWAGPPPPGPPPGPPVPAVARTWPVGPPGGRPAVIRGWEPPATVYGPGHRGVDLAAPPGAPVRAVASGRVSFAGRVAGRGVLTLELDGTDLRTTYEPVIPSVRAGEEVTPGETVATLDRPTPHCGPRSCLHWGLLRDSTYLNPLSLLPPWLLPRGPSRLLPVLGVPEAP
ncbi:peptidoglycan DD-metalloendopeptidase family protein [Streptomyces sp. NPDC001606]